MRKTLIVVLLVVAALTMGMSRQADARGHDGFYIGVGALTIPMITSEHQLTVPGGSSERVKFYPGVGGWLTFGYDFPDSKWGIQMPFEYHYFKLNREEWVHSLGSNLEAVLRLVQTPGGFEFHLVGGFGWTYLMEGRLNNSTRAVGMNIELGPGISWFFARGDTRAALTLDVPFRYIYFFGDNLSAGGTSVFAAPVRLGVTIGF